MKKMLPAILVTLGISGAVYAADENALNELASNSSMCAAYYIVVEECIKDEKHLEIKQKFAQLGDEMLMASTFFSNQKTAQSRFNLFKKQVYEEVEYSCGNISRVVEKYGDTCLLLSTEFRRKQ